MPQAIPARRGVKRDWPQTMVVNPGKGLNTLVSDSLIANDEASDLQNIQFVEAGAPAKRNGHTAVGTGLVNNPKGLGSFNVSSSLKYVLTIDGTSLKYLLSGVWTTISGASFTTGKNVVFTQAGGAMYIWNGTDAGRKLDSSLVLTAPTTSPSAGFAIYYSNKQIAAGTATQPNRLYISSAVDLSDFTNASGTISDSTNVPGTSSFAGTDANYIDVNKDDGDKITGLAKFQGVLVVFKERSIWQLTFDASGNPTVTQVSSSVGCVGHRSVDNVENDVIFLSRLGYYALGNQANYAANVIRTNEISQKIHPLITTITAANLPSTASLYSDYVFYSSIATGGTTTNNKTITFDRRYTAWSVLTNVNANAFTEYIDSSNVKHLYYAADDEAKVYEIDTSYSDNGTAINAYWQSKNFDFGDPSLYKQVIDCDIILRQLSGSVTITFITDNGTVAKTTTLSSSNDLSGTVGSDLWGAYGVGGGTYMTTITGIAQSTTSSASGVTTATTNVPYRIRLGINCRSIKVKVSNANNNETFTLLGFKFYYRPYKHTKFPSDLRVN